MIAFIFSSRRDAGAARLCKEDLQARGVEAVIAFDEADSDLAGDGDEVTDFPRQGRLFGVRCAAGMADLMARRSGGHLVTAKVDADTRLTSQGLHWLAGADERARGFHLDGISKWSGIWAAPSSIFPPASARFLRVTDCTGCPEAHLFWSYFKRWTGIERAPSGSLQVWRPGQEIRAEAWAVTLPGRMTTAERAAAVEVLHSACKSHAETFGTADFLK